MLMPLASTSPFRSAVIGAGVGGKVSQRSTALAVGAERTRSNQETIQHIALAPILRFADRCAPCAKLFDVSGPGSELNGSKDQYYGPPVRHRASAPSPHSLRQAHPL